MISIEGRVARPIGLDTFADITPVPLVLADNRVDRAGLLFDGDLTDEQIEAVWWRMTSADAADLSRREGLYVRLGEAVAGAHGAGWQTDVIAEMLRYQLGLADPA